jgi:NAD(P)-dependent dehydrogenase (short-subunit alcohol dehydrogenase family)
MIKSIEDKGGSASGYILNAVKENSIEDVINTIEAEIGAIEVTIFNLGAQIGDVSLKDLSYKQFELGWRMATFALFRTVSTVFPLMEKRGKGTLIVTSSTASVRGNPKQHSHASAMGGRRMLCQSLNAEYSPKGIHIAHIIVDGAVDAPDTLGRMLGPESFQKLRESKGMEHDGLMLPDKIADTYYHIAQQHRSVWTHELDMRSFSDSPWWNDNDNSYV